MAEELLKKIPPEKRWEITAKIISALFVIRGEKIIAPTLGKGEGIISPIWGSEKWEEIHIKVFGDGSAQMFKWVKETFDVPVKDAIDAANLNFLVAYLQMGPEWEWEIVEETPERVVVRTHKCVWMERYKEFEADPAFIPCTKGHPAWGEEGFKAISPKLTHKMTKFMPKGDPYCEAIFEFKEE